MSLHNTIYHLILEPLNLYPSLAGEAVPMIEQLMNGVLLVSSQNLQESISRIITLETTCQAILNQEYEAVITAVQPIAEDYGAPIVPSSLANNYIIHRYNNRLKHFVKNKIDDINHQFLSLKKISYDGVKVEFLPTFYDWVYEMVHQQHTFIIHNPDDNLMTNRLFPELTHHIQASINTIEEHTNSYAEEIRSRLLQVRGSFS